MMIVNMTSVFCMKSIYPRVKFFLIVLLFVFMWLLVDEWLVDVVCIVCLAAIACAFFFRLLYFVSCFFMFKLIGVVRENNWSERGGELMVFFVCSLVVLIYVHDLKVMTKNSAMVRTFVEHCFIDECWLSSATAELPGMRLSGISKTSLNLSRGFSTVKITYKKATDASLTIRATQGVTIN